MVELQKPIFDIIVWTSIFALQFRLAEWLFTQRHAIYSLLPWEVRSSGDKKAFQLTKMIPT